VRPAASPAPPATINPAQVFSPFDPKPEWGVRRRSPRPRPRRAGTPAAPRCRHGEGQVCPASPAAAMPTQPSEPVSVSRCRRQAGARGATCPVAPIAARLSACLRTGPDGDAEHRVRGVRASGTAQPCERFVTHCLRERRSGRRGGIAVPLLGELSGVKAAERRALAAPQQAWGERISPRREMPDVTQPAIRHSPQGSSVASSAPAAAPQSVGACDLQRGAACGCGAGSR